MALRVFGTPDLRGLDTGLLVASNHQSYLDPVAVGISIGEPLHYLARRSLFAVPGFGALIRALNTHPISRGEVDSSALKTVMRLLRSGEKVLVFPEGTRSRDGALGRFKPGAASIAIRCGVPLLPVCVEGAYRAWPRTSRLPRFARVGVAYGKLLQTGGANAEELTQRLRAEIERIQAFLRRALN